MKEAAHLDYGSPLPELDKQFLSVWSSHYARIADMTVPGKTILEIGAGFGILAAGLGRIGGRKIWASEHPSRSYLFQQEYQNFMNQNNVLLIANNLSEGLPFSDRVFSQVYFCDVIEHLFFQDVNKILPEIFRVLSDEGELILSTPNLNRLSNIFRFFMGYSVNPPFQVEKCGDTFGHIREFAPREIDRLLRGFGLEPIRYKFALNPYFTAEAFGAENIFSPVQAKIINRLTSVCSKFFPRLGDEIYLVARRSRNS